MLDFAQRFYARFQRSRLLAIAAGVTFYVLLAMFPAIAALVSLYGLVADAQAIARHAQALSGLLPFPSRPPALRARAGVAWVSAS